jgi:hypothetical protein
MGLLDRIGAFDRYKVSPTQGTSGLLTGAQQPMSPFAQQAARNIGGLLGMDMRTPQERLGELVSKGTGTFEEKMQVAQELAKTDPVRGLQLMESFKAEEAKKQAKAADNERQQRFRTSLISRNEAIGGSEARADTIADATPEMLLDIRKEILSDERKAAIKNAGAAGRIATGKAAGLSEKQVKSLSGLTDEQYSEVLSGLESDDKAYQNQETGEVGVYRVNRFGMVEIENENGTNRWVRPTELKLKPAVKQTEDVGRANELTSKLASEGVKDFRIVTNAARDAYRALDVNRSRLKLLDDNPDLITGGALAQLTTSALITLGSSLGIEIPATANAEAAQALIAQGVEAVGQSIKAFGAGTGLSDADREFAKLGAGATQELTAANIRRMIELANEKAEEAIGLHQRIYKTLGDEGAAPSSLAFYEAGPSLPSELSQYY